MSVTSLGGIDRSQLSRCAERDVNRFAFYQTPPPLQIRAAFYFARPMSRLKHFARAVASGYAAIAANVLYTIASVPLVLHYLTANDFGLWALVTQIAGYLLLIDFGMSGSVYRFLIDHKDEPDRDDYAAVLSTGALVFAVQGTCVALCGLALSPLLGGILGIGPQHATTFQRLVGWQCVFIGGGFALRIFTVPLQSHQRFDVMNYVQIGQFAVSLGSLWWGLWHHWGIDSMLFSSGVAIAFQNLVGAWASWRLGLLPRAGAWVRPRRSVLRKLFLFGGDIFLLTVGSQLVQASQVVIVTRTLGLEAAAVWAVCTKTFALAQQLVLRMLDFATPALTEMYVRGEHARLFQRFREILFASVSIAALIGVLIAVGNASFVQVWTKAGLVWNPVNDILVGLLLVCYTASRCLTMCVGFDKKIGVFRYVYFLEGLTFVGGAWFFAPRYGFSAVLVAAILADLAWCGAYGVRRSASFFGQTGLQVLRWFLRPLRFGILFSIVAGSIWISTRGWVPQWRFPGNVLAAGMAGGCLLWFLGLTREMRTEITARMAVRLGAPHHPDEIGTR
jgi:O-antigen/teichoic acid export membrane protein